MKTLVLTILLLTLKIQYTKPLLLIRRTLGLTSNAKGFERVLEINNEKNISIASKKEILQSSAIAKEIANDKIFPVSVKSVHDLDVIADNKYLENFNCLSWDNGCHKRALVGLRKKQKIRKKRDIQEKLIVGYTTMTYNQRIIYTKSLLKSRIETYTACKLDSKSTKCTLENFRFFRELKRKVVDYYSMPFSKRKIFDAEQEAEKSKSESIASEAEILSDINLPNSSK